MTQIGASRVRVDLGWAWRLLPSWPLVIGLAALARVLAEPRALLNDPDTYLHIAAGRWILAHAALPLHDPFSYTMAGAAWLPSEWLSEIVMAAAYRALGWAGPILLAACGFAAALAILTRHLLLRLEALPALVAAVMSAALLQPHLLARPHALALPVLVLWSARLLAARDEARPPPFAALPLMALWANLHGSFLFGLALAVFLAAEAVLVSPPGNRGRECRSWGGFVFAAAAAALLTPNGVAGLVQPLRLTAMPALQSSFIEWMSPDLQAFPALEYWLLGALFIGFATGAQIRLSRVVLLLGLVHMALQHLRHADLLALVGPLAIVGSLAPRLAAAGLAEPSSSFARMLARLTPRSGAPANLVAVAVAGALALPVTMRPAARADDAVTPAAALTAAGRLGLSGPVFNSEAFGGYLIFRGVPDFIDGRIEMYGNDFLAEDVAAERGDPAALARVLAGYHVRWALLAPQAGAAAVLDRLPGWQRAYADADAVVYRRVDPTER